MPLNPWKLRRKPDVASVTITEQLTGVQMLTIVIRGYILDDDRNANPHVLYSGRLDQCPPYVLKHCPAWVLELAGWGGDPLPDDEPEGLFTPPAQPDRREA